MDLCRDPTDVPVLGTALAGGCALLISIDRDLLDMQTNFGSAGTALRFSSDTPKMRPIPGGWTQGPRRTSLDEKSRISTNFRKIFRDSRTPKDVAGRLWSWDGWPPKRRAK
jgi:hypothetical protein